MQYTIKRGLIFFAATILATVVQAATITVGKPLPAISISNLGECVLKGGDAVFQPWSSSQLRGKVQILEYVAARAGIDKIHKPFYDAVKAAHFPADKVAITKLVNSDDAFWGTSGLVAGAVKKNKKATPGQTLVVDADGLGRKQWDLQKKNAALAILDPSGTVLFFKEGKLTGDEISHTVDRIRQTLKKEGR